MDDTRINPYSEEKMQILSGFSLQRDGKEYELTRLETYEASKAMIAWLLEDAFDLFSVLYGQERNKEQNVRIAQLSTKHIISDVAYSAYDVINFVLGEGKRRFKTEELIESEKK